MRSSLVGESTWPERHRVGADSPEQSLRSALVSLVTIGCTRPHLYRLMFTTPAGDVSSALPVTRTSRHILSLSV
jgi:hypothetical protein